MKNLIVRILKFVYSAFYLVIQSLCLFFLLPGCFLSNRMFNIAWRKYHVQPLPKNIFNLCVQWLLFVGGRIGLSYGEVNILIFCIIWPLITIFSIVLNIVLLCSWFPRKYGLMDFTETFISMRSEPCQNLADVRWVSLRIFRSGSKYALNKE